VQDNAGTGNLLSVDATNTSVGTNIILAAAKSLTLLGGNTASRPAGTAGEIYYDTDTDTLLTYNGTKWVADRGEYIIVAASDSTQAEKDSADYVADGTSDETEINSALTAASGGKVLLLAGTYVADGTILIPNNTTLTGVGPGTVIELADIDVTDNLIENSDTTTGTGVVIRDLKLDGRDDLNTAGIQYGIFINGVGDSAAKRAGAIVENVTAIRFRDNSIVLENTEISNVTKTHTSDSGTGIRLQTGSNYNAITSNKAEGNDTQGLYISNSDNNQITDNTISGAGYGIYLNNIVGNSIDNNRITSTGSSGIYFFNSDNNNTVKGNVITGGTTGSGIYADESYTMIIADNYITNFAFGINIVITDNTQIINNTVKDSGGATANNGIYLDYGVTRSQVINNLILDSSCTTTCRAIVLDTAEYVYLSGNRFSGSATDAASIYETGTTATIYANQQVNTTTSSVGDVSDFLYRGSANSTTAFTFQNAAGGNILNIDTTNSELEVGNGTTPGKIIVDDGGTSGYIQVSNIRSTANITVGVSDTTGTLLVVDTKTDSGDPTGVNGGIYYNSNANKLRCYQNGTWYDCLSAEQIESVELAPEYTGAIFQGDGTNNTGTLTSGFCSGTSRKSINTSVCGATEEHNYYEWTTSTGDNDYDIYIRYKLPSDFNGFASDTTIAMSGWRTDATNNKVELALFQANNTQCGTTTEVATGTAAWSTVSLGGNETGCTFAADDVVMFRVRMTATGTEYVRAGAITFSYVRAY
jgi:parallel beta-helix repeat protein